LSEIGGLLSEIGGVA